MSYPGPDDVCSKVRSLNGEVGPLGTGWRHSYDGRLTENTDRSVLARVADLQRVYVYNPATSKYDPLSGDSSTLVKDQDHWAITEAAGTKYTFAADGQLTSIVDRFNNAVSLGYANGDLTSVTDGTGRTVTFSYDPAVAHRLTNITDPRNNSYTFQYDVSGRLQRVVYPVTDTGVAADYWEYTYKGATTLLETKRDPAGKVTRYGYDNSRITAATDPKGKVRAFLYPAATDTVRNTIFTDKDGGQWQDSYDVSKGV